MHIGDGVWIPHFNKLRFLRFYFYVSLTEKIIEYSRQCLMAFSNTSELHINNTLCVVFSTLFSVCGNVFTHDLPCLIYQYHVYYFNNAHPIPISKKFQHDPETSTKNCNFLSHVHFHERPRRK